MEIDSVVSKFKLLKDAGYEASLNLETMLGEVKISLNCKVGRSLPPPSSPIAQSSIRRYRSPSYYRRQARRKAQREAETEVTNDLAGEVREDVNVSSEEEDDVV